MTALEEYRDIVSRIGKEYQPADWNDGATSVKTVADAAIAELKLRAEELEDEIASVHHYLLEMFEFFWHDGNSRTHLNVVEWLERPHTTAWMVAVNASEGRDMARLTAPEPKEEP